MIFLPCMKHCLNLFSLEEINMQSVLQVKNSTVELYMESYCHIFIMIYFYWTIPQLAHNFPFCEF